MWKTGWAPSMLLHGLWRVASLLSGRGSARWRGIFRPRPASPLPIMLALLGLVQCNSIAVCQAPADDRGGRPAVALPTVEAQWKAKLNANTVSIIAGSPEETYLDIAHDLAIVLNDDNLRVLPMVGMGGAQNIRDVMYLKGVDIGITSSHMLRYFASTGELGGSLDERLAYITRMFLEEMHVVAGPEIKTIEDLAGKKVNLSEPGSSTQITARDVFGLLSIAFDEVNLSQADAIAKVKTGELAATVVFSGKPVGLLSRLSTADNLHLLEVPYTRALENTYLPAQLESALYPNLIAAGNAVQTIAVDAVLVTNNWPPTSERYHQVAKFVDSFFSRFAELRKPPRHPKWLEVNLGAELPGWRRLPEAQDWLDRTEQAQNASERTKSEGFLGDKSRDNQNLPEIAKQRLFREFFEWSAGEGQNR